MLNKIPVLDKGYVALISSSLDAKAMRELESRHFNNKINKQLWELATLTLEIRCPIFVQIFFQQVGLSVINVVEKKVECYTPDLSEIGTGNHQTDKEIAEYMKQTTEALILTALAFEKDGLNRFTANSLMPVSVYNTIIVSGNLQKWINLLKKKTPSPISMYVDTIYEIAENEWGELGLFIGRNNDKKESVSNSSS